LRLSSASVAELLLLLLMEVAAKQKNALPSRLGAKTKTKALVYTYNHCCLPPARALWSLKVFSMWHGMLTRTCAPYW
jgi:hypothetical protein